MRRLTIEGKTTIFKTLAISKISYTCFNRNHIQLTRRNTKRIFGVLGISTLSTTLYVRIMETEG